MKESYQKTIKERNSLQQKIFKMQSDFCSVEIERDLEKETSRYLEEQVSSVNSSVLLKENELVSLRKRYKLLNEGFLNSETLREGLERDVCEQNRVIKELEERLVISEGNLEAKAAELSLESAKAKLETELTTLNETLKKERNSKRNLEEMLTNIDQERSLLLKEVEELRGENKQQLNEVNVLRDLLHEKNKQEQLHHRQEEQFQREKQQQHSNEITQLRESKIQLSDKITILENENKKLEDELYQQLAVLEKLEVENKSLAGAEKELGEISDKLEVLGLGNIEQLITENSVLREDKHELERKIRHLEHEISSVHVSQEKLDSTSSATSKDCFHLGVNSTKSSSVRKSEYLKLKFQLKSVTDELNTLKQAIEPKKVKERRSKKHGNSMAKKWLKTMKDAIANEDDLDGEQCGTVLLENQLHEANIRVNALQHELVVSRKENEVLLSSKKRREEEMEALKQRLVESQETHNSSLKETMLKLQKAKNDLKNEERKIIRMEENIAYLEENNQETCIELEKIKEKFQSSEKEKQRTRNELESFKNDIMKNFGSLNIQAVSNSFTLLKEKSVEYINIIEANKNNQEKLTQEINSLHQVNIVLREELHDVRIQLETKEKEISNKNLNDSIAQKRESERLQAVMQALESSKQNETELLAMYTTEKRERETLHDELMKLNTELQETKILLSEKEKECETTNLILHELEATCEVYEVEFEKAATAQENKENESSEDELSDSGSDSTADKFREMQEALQERMTVKVKRLQNKLEETLAALSSCQKMNIDLQKKMHDTEKRNLEKVEIDERTPDKEFIETILKKLSEKEEKIQEILLMNTSTPEDGKRECHTENNSDELLSSYKETIKQLRIDNAKKEVRLAEADERIAELENKLEMCQNVREDSKQKLEKPDDLTFESAVSLKEDLVETDNVAINDNLKAELESTTAKYVNLKAAFEGCSRRLKILEEGEDGVETEEPGTVNEVERYKSSGVKGMVMPKFISPLQEKMTKTAEVQTEFLEASNFENYQETMNNSSFSEISCAFIESDPESESIGSDRMVIELTLTENDMDSLEFPETCDEFLQERLEYETEFGRLRAKIIELEKLNSTTTSEIHRVKEYSFRERVDLESKSRSLEQLNNMMKVKLDAIELERDSLEKCANQSDIGHSEAKQELQRIKISMAEEKQATENTIKELQDQGNTFRKEIMKMEREEEELRMTIKELHEKLLDSSQETERVKNDFQSKVENYINAFTEFEHKIEVYKKEKKNDDLKISELERNVCVAEDEIRKCKNENLKLEESIKELESMIFNLQKQNTDLKCEKEIAFTRHKELEHENEMVVKNQELSVASNLSEKQDLENKIIQLQTTITMLEETLLGEKTKNADFNSKIRIENEQRETLLNEKKEFEEATKQLQERMVILEKEMEEMKFEKMNSDATGKELKEKFDLLYEEKGQRVKVLSDERQSLEATNKEFQNMITGLNEKYMVENMEKDSKISIIQEENLSLKVKKEKLESQALSYVDEIQRIKSLSFNEREKLEKLVKDLQETNVFMQNMVDEDRQVKENLNLTINDFQAKYLYLQKELERVKICSFNENQLEDKIEKLTAALSSIEIKFENLKVEKDHLLSKKKELDQVIWRLQEELERVKVCAFEERQNKMAEAENCNVLAEESKTNFETQILERDKQILSLKLTVNELDGLRNTLESDKHMQDEDIRAFKIREEGLQQEVKRFEENVIDYENQISTLNKTLSELNEDKRCLKIKMMQQDEKLSLANKVVDELHDETKQLQAKIVERDEQISLLQLNVGELKELTNTLENDALKSSKEQSTAQVLLENVEKQKKLLKDDVVSCKSEIAMLKSKASQLEEEKQCLTTSVEEKDRELRTTEEKLNKEISLLKKNGSQLQVEKEDFRNCINGQADELSHLKAALEKLEGERNVLKEESVKQTNEMSSLETTVAEIDSEKECLANVIAKQDEELSTFKMTLNKLQEEQKDFQDHIKNRDDEILLQKENVSRLLQEIDTYAKNAAKHDEELSQVKISKANLEDDKIRLKNEVRKRDTEIASLESKISHLEDEKKSFANGIAVKDEELSVMKICVGDLEERIKVLEKEIIKRDTDISLQKATIVELENSKESLVHDIAEKDEEIIVVKMTVETLQAEKKAMEEHNNNQDNEISLIQTTLVDLRSKNQSLVDDMASKVEELSAVKDALENIEHEKKAFEEQNISRNNEKSLLKKTLLELEEEKELMAKHISKLQNEKDSILNDLSTKGEELSILTMTVEKLQHQKKELEVDVLKREHDMSQQQAKVASLEKESQTLGDSIIAKDEELSSMKTHLEKIQSESKSLEDYIAKCDSEILLLKSEVSKLQDEKESFTNQLLKQEVELSNAKITVNELENEKNAFEDEISKRDSGISLLESKVFGLESEKETLLDDITKKDEKLSAFIDNIEKYEDEKKCFESKIVKDEEEILSLTSKVDKIAEAKRSLEIDLQKREEELMSTRETLRNLRDEYKFMENNEVELNEKFSQYTMKIEKYQEEISFLKNDLQKVTNEKENIESKMKEMNEKSKCDEEDFDKLIAGYLQEIDSWKKSFGAMEETMTVLRNETEKLQCEKDDLENTVKEMRESERANEEMFQENIKMYYEDIDSWKMKVQSLESDAEILRETLEKLERECESKKLEINRANEEKEESSKLQQEMVTKFQEERDNSEKQWLLVKEKEMENLRFELETKLQTMESQHATMVRELYDRNSGMEQLKVDVSQLTNVLSRKDEEILNLKSKVVELEETTHEANNRISELEQQDGTKEQDLKLSRICVEELREDSRKLTKIISEKEEKIFTLTNELEELSERNKELEESKLSFGHAEKKYEDELQKLRDMLKLFEAKELSTKNEIESTENELTSLRNELSAIQQQYSEDEKSEKSVKNSIEKSQERLRILLADIDETTKIKVSAEEELRKLNLTLEQRSEEKTKVEMDLFCLKEITEELTKGKLTLLEEIARLSDQKKEGQEFLNSEFARLRVSNNELQKNNQKIEKENAELIVQISSLKVTLATVQSAYEQTQDEIKSHKKRLDETLSREKHNKQEREKIDEEYKKTEVQLKHLEEQYRNTIVENKDLSLSFNETKKRLEALEKEMYTIKSENVLLKERIKQQGSGENDEGLDNGKSSSQALRKRLKELRAKLSEEKKQRELHEFEIKNLKEKVERLVKKDKENEVHLEDTRKKLLEVKTERDGLLMDLDSLNKRKKKDMEGYTSRIETLEDELR